MSLWLLLPNFSYPCYNKHMRYWKGARLGDTLIEVTLAIGIFSLVAIAVVSVVSSSTSGAQNALETTLTREEIDAQAEALRFIQESYISSLDTANKPNTSLTNDDSLYRQIWETIVSNAHSENYEQITSFSPKTCNVLYDKDGEDSVFAQKAFVINTKELGNANIQSNMSEIDRAKIVNNIVLQAQPPASDGVTSITPNLFQAATTYPHLVYKNDDSSLLDVGTGGLEAIEGIYIVAVRDPSSTVIVDSEGNVDKKAAAYFDFYIRSCWYATGSDVPSTISTVVRLYDPNAMDISAPTEPIPDPTYTIVYDDNGANSPTTMGVNHPGLYGG